MNIGQLARQHQMTYRFIERSTDSGRQAQILSQLSALDSRISSKNRGSSGNASLLRNINAAAKADSTSSLLQSVLGTSKSSSTNGLLQSATGSSKSDSMSSLLQSMGISSKEGNTIRQMAQRQVQALEKQRATASSAQTSGASTLSQLLTARQQYTPISDKATEAMQKKALEDAKNSVGEKDGDNDSAASRVGVIQEQLKDVDPSKRAAAFNTMNKVYESETNRLEAYIKEKDENWQSWGDKFDTSILDDYKPGVNVWI